MERYTPQSIKINDLIYFVHNELPEKKMESIEHFLQQNDIYAELTDNLIDLINDHNFSLSDTQKYLTAKPVSTQSTKIKHIFLSILENKYNHLKLSLQDFELQVKAWFLSAPPLEYGVALMSNDLQVLSPANDTHIESIIQFELSKPIQKNEELLLHIFESRNQKPLIELTFKNAEQQFSIDTNKHQLHPGIYYWRMQLTESGQKAEGSFTVKPLYNIF